MSSFKFSVFSDLHAHNYKSFDSNGSRLNNAVQVIRDVFNKSNAQGVDTIFFGGDLFHLHKMIPTVVENALISVFGEMFKKYPNTTLYAITGNHDFEKKNLFVNLSATANGALKHLSQIFDNFRLLDGLTTTQHGSGVTISGVPYYDYKEHFIQAVNDTRERLDPNEFNILLTHQTPSGLIDFPIESDTDPTNDYNGFDLVLNGHIHTRRQLTEKYFLIGSPLAQNFSDPLEERGFSIFTITDKSEFIQEFINLNYPKFITIREGEDTPDNYPNDYVKVLPSFADIKLQTSLTDTEIDFDLGVKAKDLVNNYGKFMELSPDLLAVGLKFVE